MVVLPADTAAVSNRRGLPVLFASAVKAFFRVCDDRDRLQDTRYLKETLSNVAIKNKINIISFAMFSCLRETKLI